MPNFSGTLLGNGYNILNYKIEIVSNGFSRDKLYGLFGTLTGRIENFNIKNSSIIFSDQNLNAHSGTGWLSAGMVNGGGGGTIRNVCVYGGKIGVFRERSEIGGIAGIFTGTIEDCNVYGITLEGNGDMGGIAGDLQGGVISNCRVEALNDANRSAIRHYSVANGRSVGGLIGYSNEGTLEYSHVFNTDFTLGGNANSERIATKIGFGVGHQNGGKIHLISSGAGNDNKKTTNLSTANKEWQAHYFKLAAGQIGRVTDKPVIN